MLTRAAPHLLSPPARGRGKSPDRDARVSTRRASALSAVRRDGDLASPCSRSLRNDDRNDAPIERRLNAIGVDGLRKADDSLELTKRTLRDVDLVLITVFRSGPRSPDGQRALVEREVDRIVRDSGDVERHQE